MDAKTTATGIAEALADVETAALEQGGNLEMAEKLDTLHKRLRVGLYRFGGALGLTSDDIAELDNLGPQQRGGEPKDDTPALGDEE